MSDAAYIAISLAIPFLGTVLGGTVVFFLKKKIPPTIEKTLLGFAGGIMVAAAFFSLLVPSLEDSKSLGDLSILPPLIGFACGIGMMLLIDTLLPHLHPRAKTPEGLPSRASKTSMMVLAIAIHNFPEGLTVGVGLAAAVSGHEVFTFMGALSLAIGIAIQNFPEGAVVSLPLSHEGYSKWKAFGLSALSGAIEPLAALLALAIAPYITPALPYLLSFAAGAMIYAVVEELVPEMQEGGHTNLPTIGFAVGFALMMVLDVVIG